MIQNIFVSYRRSDSQDITGRLYDRLVTQFGKGRVFKDVDSIPIGIDFRKHLSEVVGSCEVLLAVIGDHWLDARDDTGKRRLDSASDLVRIEIEAALARDIPVVPVLVGKAKMPSETDLPPSLAPLVFRQAVPVRPDPDFHRDMDRLNTALRAALEAKLSVPKVKVEVVSDSVQTPPVIQKVEPAPESSQLVRQAIDRLETANINYEVVNLVPVARKLHEASRGGAVLPLCQVLTDGKAAIIDQYKALKLLALVLRWPESKPFLGAALDALLDGGILRANLQNAAIEAFVGAPVPPRDKWERLFDALTFASDSVLPGIVNAIAQVIPPPERHRTTEQLADRLEATADWSVVYSICNVLKQLGDRTAVPSLIRTLEISLPQKAAAVSNLLAEWRIVDAGTAIRSAIELGRYGADNNVATLVKNLYLVEGSVCYGYLAEVLRDAVPSVQYSIIYNLQDINDPMFADVVNDLAANSFDSDVRKRAAEFISKRQVS